MKKFIVLGFSTLVGFAVLATGAFAMSINNVGKVCLFSGISGVITLNGVPAANARLVRTGDRDGAKTDETTTDENGFFSLPAMYERTITKYLPQEFVASQEIKVFYKGETYSIWRGVKRSPEENIESRGKPLIVKCELNSEEHQIRVNHSPIISLCTWDVEPDPEFNRDYF